MTKKKNLSTTLMIAGGIATGIEIGACAVGAFVPTAQPVAKAIALATGAIAVTLVIAGGVTGINAVKSA